MGERNEAGRSEVECDMRGVGRHPIQEAPATLLERRGQQRKEALRTRRQPDPEQLPGGGILYDDVLPKPVWEDHELQAVNYDGWEGFAGLFAPTHRDRW